MNTEHGAAEPSRSAGGLAQRALEGALWTFSAAAAKGVVQILVLMVLARMLDPSAFGVVAAGVVVVRLAGLMSQLGIGPAIIQKPDLRPQDVSTAFAFLLLSGGAAAVAVALAAPALAGFVFRMEALAPVLVSLAPAILLDNASEVAAMLLRRRLQFRQVAGVALISYAVGYGAVGVGLAVLGLGIWALVGAFIAQNVIRTALLLTLERHPKSLRIELAALAQLLRFGGGLVAFRLANEAALQMDKLIVGRWLGVEALGLYGRAHQIAMLPAAFLGQSVLLVLFPVMSRIQQDRGRLALAYRRGVTLGTLATAPVSAVIAVLAAEIVAVVLGPQWQTATAPLAVLSLGLALRINARIAGSAAAATGATYNMAWRQAVYTAAVVAGALVGQLWGLTAVAVGILLAQLAQYLMMAQLVRSLTSARSSELVRAHVPGLLAAALVAPPVWLVRWLLLELGLGPLALLGAGTLTAAATLLLMMHAIPRLVLGPDGAWALETLLARVPKRNRDRVRRLLGRWPAPVAT